MKAHAAGNACLRLALPLLLLSAAPAFADECETNFKREGNPLTGLRYSTNIKVDGLGKESAIAQMAAIGRKGKYDVLEEDGANGVLVLEQPESAMARNIPIAVTAESEGTATRIGMLVKLNRGVLTTGDAVKKELCLMLGSVKAGAAGRAVASSAPTQEAPKAMEANMFASMINRQSDENYAMINPRYKGKRYTLSGWANGVHGANGRYSVFFERYGDGGSLLKPRLMCRMAADAKAYAMTLRDGERIKLTGTFSDYDGNRVEMIDCRPAK